MNRLIAALVSLPVLVGCGAFDFYIMDAAYEGMHEVREDNAINRGWIPEHLPATAHSIRERHSGDTNEGWGTFKFREWDPDALALYWRKVSVAPLPRDLNRFREAPKIDWWPESFDGFTCYTGVEDRRFWLAVDFTNSVGYFWQG